MFYIDEPGWVFLAPVGLRNALSGDAGGKKFPEDLHLLRLTLLNPSLPCWAAERIPAAGTLARGSHVPPAPLAPRSQPWGWPWPAAHGGGPGHREGVQQHHSALGGGDWGAGAVRASAPSSPSA